MFLQIHNKDKYTHIHTHTHTHTHTQNTHSHSPLQKDTYMQQLEIFFDLFL